MKTELFVNSKLLTFINFSILVANERGEIWIIQDYNITDYKECAFGNDKVK
jgi:hypothetical protein